MAASPSSRRRLASAGLSNEVFRRYVDELVGHLVRGVEERSRAYHEYGRSPEEVAAPRELAERMLAAFPEPSRWDDLLGPFLTTTQMTRLLGGISRQALAERRERATVLALVTADGVTVYPSFQLDAHHQVLQGLPEVLRCFGSEVVDGWTLAGWLVARQGALGDVSVIDWLHQRRELAPVLELARDASRGFAQ